MIRSTIISVIILHVISCGNPQTGMVLIPAGEFVFGINPDQRVTQFMSDATLALNAQPAQKMHIKDFYIDLYEVTYEAFRQFKPKIEYAIKDQQEPVRGVSWYEAEAYCFWVGKRLPTEMEWEKAARGTDERLFVWGSEFDRKNANFGKQVRPIGKFRVDTSTYGPRDMNGNVSEWTSSWYQPYSNSKHKDRLFGEKVKILRGGSFHKQEHGFMKEFTMLPYRNFAPPRGRFWDTGFRCAKST